MTATRLRVQYEDVEWVIVPDEDADTSYLEQEGWEDRLDEYRRGQFGYVGVVARCRLVFPTDRGHFASDTLTSPGLWGIEDDSEPAYLADLGAEQITELMDMLAMMNSEPRP